jgi:hypothetical protein
MAVTIAGMQTLWAVIIIFAVIGLVRGWQKMGVVLAGTVLTALVIIEDREGRLVKLINSLPKVVDLLLDTKLGAKPLVTDANKPFFYQAVLFTGVALSWIVSQMAVDAKGTKVNLAQPVRSLLQLVLAVAMGAGTGYLLVVKSYEYLLLLPADVQTNIFQTLTITMLPLPESNVFRQYESLLYLGLVVAVVIGIVYTGVFGKGYRRGKTDTKTNAGGSGAKA